VRVVFRFHTAERDIRCVELLGETRDWRNAVTLTRDDGPCHLPGFACELELPVGVYQYKFLLDGSRWVLDPDNPRTRSDGGARNSVLAVGGAPEPLLFAPAPPWVEELERGGLRLLVGVRKPAPTPPALRASEDGGATWSPAEAQHAFDEDEHAFFVATVPTSAAVVTLAIEGYQTVWTRPPARERAPAWWKNAAIYTIFVDRFRPALDTPSWELDPGAGRAAGGHLEGVRRSLDELAQLGVDTLYLTPVHVAASVHRYDVVDPLQVDPALGGEAAYDALVRDAGARGMRIVQDVSFAHAGRGFPAYDDVLANGRGSRFAPWFVWEGERLVHYGTRTDAPLLDLEHAEVQTLVLEAVAYWARRGASGIRLDMTAEVPLALGRRIRARFRDLVPDGVVLGEVVPAHAWRWRTGGVVDAATDFGFHSAVTELVCDPRMSAKEALERITRAELLRGGDSRSSAVRFLSTHDHPRLTTLAAARGAEARVLLAYAMLATMPGVPMLLYGEEVGMRSEGALRELEDVWPDRAPYPWAAARRDPRLGEHVRALFRTRAGSVALRSGAFCLLHADEATLVYRREADGEVVDVALNFEPAEKTIEVDDDALPRMTALTSVGACTVEGAALRLAPLGAVVVRRERALGRAVAPPLARRNLALRDEELRAGRARVASRPSRFFFSLTERCNLRCEHCITHAPERTRDGTARTMTPAVLDALRADLGLATYVAFVHGGESLTAPILFDVLAAVRAARGDEPCVAHLLTNGVLLGPAMAERLVRAGVSSLSISIDGATAATNDAIRTGARLDEITARLREILAWRRGERVDLRVGLSYVVLGQNLHELDALMDLAAALGVDWVKLEEGVPATAFAKRSLVSCAAPGARRAIEDACRRGRERGLVVVDHTIDRTVWRCRLEEDTDARTFLEGDEFANRAEIHPCRAPWETVCIEPNGDVRVLDFFGPIVGNVTRAPLAELWSSGEAVLSRERARTARLCGPSGPVVCL
jgi:cyclomaltodextrinase / maltogenic alpha-amylase / neopullulanase